MKDSLDFSKQHLFWKIDNFNASSKEVSLREKYFNWGLEFLDFISLENKLIVWRKKKGYIPSVISIQQLPSFEQWKKVEKLQKRIYNKNSLTPTKLAVQAVQLSTGLGESSNLVKKYVKNAKEIILDR